MAEYPVRVRPGASRTRVGGAYGEPPMLVVAVTDSATEGRANAAVLRALSKSLGVPVSRLDIVRGHTSRTKAISIAEPPPDLDQRWEALMSSGTPGSHA